MSDQEADPQDIFTMENGVKLRIKNGSPLAFNQILREGNAAKPRPPVVWIEEKGREEENPNDPDYINALLQYESELGLRALHACFPICTELLSCPDDVMKPDDPDLAELIETMGLQPAKGRYGRYVQWLELIACSANDLEELGNTVLRRIGVKEEDVAEAAQRFRSLQGRPPDMGSGPGQHRQDGSDVPTSNQGTGGGN